MFPVGMFPNGFASMGGGSPTPTSPPNQNNVPNATDPLLVYATDEDIAIRAYGDFGIIVPRSQKVCYGTDGQFAAQMGGNWTMTSATIDFAGFLVQPQMVFLLSVPGGVLNGQFVKGAKEELVVSSVATGQVTFRRLAMAVPSGTVNPPIGNVGMPPGPPAGLTNVTYECYTFMPQILRTCWDLNRRYGINDQIAGRNAAQMLDLFDLRDATVLMTLQWAYLAAARQGDEASDVLMRKAKTYKEEMDELLGRLQVRWQNTSLELNTGKFSMRIGR